MYLRIYILEQINYGVFIHYISTKFSSRSIVSSCLATFQFCRPYIPDKMKLVHARDHKYIPTVMFVYQISKLILSFFRFFHLGRKIYHAVSSFKWRHSFLGQSYIHQFCYNLIYYLVEKLEDILKYIIDTKIDVVYIIFKKLR